MNEFIQINSAELKGLPVSGPLLGLMVEEKARRHRPVVKGLRSSSGLLTAGFEGDLGVCCGKQTEERGGKGPIFPPSMFSLVMPARGGSLPTPTPTEFSPPKKFVTGKC